MSELVLTWGYVFTFFSLPFPQERVFAPIVRKGRFFFAYFRPPFFYLPSFQRRVFALIIRKARISREAFPRRCRATARERAAALGGAPAGADRSRAPCGASQPLAVFRGSCRAQRAVAAPQRVKKSLCDVAQSILTGLQGVLMCIGMVAYGNYGKLSGESLPQFPQALSYGKLLRVSHS